MVTSQLRLKLEALQGSRGGGSGLRAGRASGPRRTDSVQAAMAAIGFSWDQRGFWAHRATVQLADLGLAESALSGIRMRLLSEVLAEDLSGPALFFDLETTGLQRGAGNVPFLYGWAEADGPRLQVEQWLLADLGQELPLVEAALAKIKAAGVLVTYNGASFDVPLLRTRVVMNRVEKGWPATPHLDLLPLVRRLFRHRLRRCTLRQAEEVLLGMERHEDLPGSEAPERFRRFLSSGDPSSLGPVARHNLLDVVSLSRLVDHLEQHVEVLPAHPADWYSLGRFAEARGNWDRAGTLYRGAIEQSPPPLDRAAALRRARLLRRGGQELEARLTWREAWDRWRDPEAAEALCVDLEHRAMDLQGALDLANDAMSTAPAGWDRRFARRIWRLESRLGTLVRGGKEVPQATRIDPQRPWAGWLPGGDSYEAWMALGRGSRPRQEHWEAASSLGTAREASR